MIPCALNLSLNCLVIQMGSLLLDAFDDNNSYINNKLPAPITANTPTTMRIIINVSNPSLLQAELSKEKPL